LFVINNSIIPVPEGSSELPMSTVMPIELKVLKKKKLMDKLANQPTTSITGRVAHLSSVFFICQITYA